MEKHDVSSLTAAGLGGSPVSPSLAIAAREKLNVLISPMYGMTECCGGSIGAPFGSSGGWPRSFLGFEKSTLRIRQILRCEIEPRRAGY